MNDLNNAQKQQTQQAQQDDSTNPQSPQGAPASESSGKQLDLYDRFAERSSEIFESGKEKGRDAWERAMELARQQLTAAGEFTAAQGEVFKHYLQRDLEQTATDMRQLGEDAKDALQPTRLGAGALSSLAKLMHATGSLMTAWSARAEAALEYKTGEITSAGTLTCVSCGQNIHLHKTSIVPPCATCHATRFRKGY